MKSLRYIAIRSLVALLTIGGAQFAKAQAQFKTLEKEYNNSGILYYAKPHADWNSLTVENLSAAVSEVYGVENNWSFRVKNTQTDEFGRVVRVNQNVDGIDVFGGDMIVIYGKDNKIRHIMGSARHVNPRTKVNMTAESAVEVVIEDLGINELHYDQMPDGEVIRPKVKLVYAPVEGKVDGEYVKCYQVDIVLNWPERFFYYINAESGEIEHSHSALTHSVGSGNSLYSGNKNFNTTWDPAVNKFWANDSIRKIEAWNYLHNQFHDGVCDGRYWYRDADNNWNANWQRSVVDVMWGMSKVYDYYKTKHNRTSYDNAGAKIVNRVNWDDIDFNDKKCPLDSITGRDSTYNNAFWNGSSMTYGQGNGVRFSDLVSLDVVGHEFTHAVVEKTAGLVYEGESGALNEAFADMFGCAIEFYGKAGNYRMGEECFTPGTAGDELRRISDPKHRGDPDTYEGDNWENTHPDSSDHGGVHTNSGVGYYWWYLVAEGGDAINDKGDDYDVDGIGREKAEKIAYRALTMYMSSRSDYEQARKATLLATEDLYGGEETNEYKQVCEAWFAVNVGERCCTDSMDLDFEIEDVSCAGKEDGSIDLTITNHRDGASPSDLFIRWFKSDTTSAVLSNSEDINGLEAENYIVIVKDTVGKCEEVGDTTIEEPDSLKLRISGARTYTGPCERSFTITLTCQASGGTQPYVYSWDNQRRQLQAGGRTGWSRIVAAAVIDENNCIESTTATVTYVPIRCSYDPNDIIGPPAYGDEGWVSKFATLPYKIRYENDPKFATGPAQRVEIRHTLDSNVNINSFRLSDFGFYNYNFEVPDNSITYSKRLDIRDSFDIFLDVTAGINTSTREAFWIFESIDPNTGLPPIDGNKGFLQVNDTVTHKGEGYVDYTIKPASHTVTGDSIRAIANITFDDNPDISTPRISNLIDAVAPTSTIDSLPSVIDSSAIYLHLLGSDDSGGSGLAGWDIYVSINGGAFSLAASNQSDSVYAYSGNYGNTYSFFTRAFDNTSNYEALKTVGDVTVTIAPDQFFKPIDSTTSLCSGDTLVVTWFETALTSYELQYTADSGATFTTINSNVNVADTLYTWVIPTSIAGQKNYWLRAVGDNNTILDSSTVFELIAGPDIALDGDTSFCEGVSFSLNLDAGAGYASYLWSTTATTQSISVSSFNTYAVTVTNSLGCDATESISVSQDLNPVVSNSTVTHPSCAANADGSISLVVVSGTAPYTYNWSNGLTVEDITGLMSGIYTVTISDTKSCGTVHSDTLTVSQPIQVIFTISDVKCNGGNDGSVSTSLSGGVSPYSYKWGDGSTGTGISGLTAADYYLTVTDTKNCFVIDTATVGEPTALGVSHAVTNVDCYDNSTGSVDLTVTGGTTAYSFAWSNGASTEDIGSLADGTYSVLVTDANGCEIRDTAVVTEPTALSVSGTVTDVSCNGGANGAVDLSVSGATPSYTYKWSNNSTNQDVNGLSAATYSVTVTDNNNCVETMSFDVDEPDALTITLTPTDVKCNGGNDGSVNLTASGGTSPYSYAWSNGASTEDINGVAAATYSVTLTDANNCVITGSTTVDQPTALAVSTSVVDIKCNGDDDGQIDLTVSGGTTGYTYMWSNTSTVQDQTGLDGGTYSVTVTDANNCVITTSAFVFEPDALVLSLTPAHVKCKNGSDGSVNLAVTGGTSPFTYKWTNNETTEDIGSLTANSYGVTVTDNNSCVAQGSTTVSEPNLLVASTTAGDVSCNGGADGTVDLTVQGGTTPYAYSWSNNANTQDINGVTIGVYSVTVTDANNCTTTSTATVTEPTALTISNTVKDLLCNGDANGEVDLTVGGGTPGYSYAWSNSATTSDLNGLSGGTYTVVVTDANNCVIRDTAVVFEPTALVASHTVDDVDCNGGADGSVDLTVTGGTSPYTYKWSNNSTDQDINGLSAATYTVTITDANNCVLTRSATVGQPTALTISHTVDDVDCKNGNDGGVDLTVGGGTPGYSFLWSNSATTQDINGLEDGTYTVVVTDANNCVIRDTAVVGEPTALASSTSVIDVLCNGGNDGGITLTPSGGTSPYTYVWSNSTTAKDLSNVVAGTYTVTITDANGCTKTDQGVVNQPTALGTSISVNNVSCNAGNDGSVDLTVTGGSTPYSYVWSNSATSQDINTLQAGTYYVTVTDDHSCVILDTAVITQPTALSLTKQVDTVLCFGGANGVIDITVSGGTGAYTYNWENGSNAEDRSGLTTGTYIVEVRDANSCLLVDTTFVSQPSAPLTSTINSDSVDCFGENTGNATIVVLGGTPGYTYRWNNGVTASNIANVFKGQYTVVVNDVNNCVLYDTVDIEEPDVLTGTLVPIDALCHGDNSGIINFTPTGGTMPYTFNWTSGTNTEDALSLTAGTYTVTLTDRNACVFIDSATVNEPAAPISSSMVSTAVKCFAGSDGALDLSVSGGTAPYKFLWSNNETSEDIAGLMTGDFDVLIVDFNNCEHRDTGFVDQPAAPLSTTFTISDVLCFGGNDGSVDMTVIGGTSPYTYLWSDGSNTEDIGSKATGSYYVTITDANDCVLIDTAFVDQPAAPLSTAIAVSDVLCFGGNSGSLDLTVNGGTSPYSFAWSNSEVTEDINTLTQGQYDVLVTDANNCTIRDTATVGEPAAPISATFSVTPTSCFQGNDGEIDLTPAGGTAPYSFAWSTGANSEDVNGLSAQTYFVTITDDNNCVFVDSVSVTEPPELVTTTEATTANIDASNGYAFTMPEGGTPPYSFQWDDPLLQTADTASDLVIGTYTVLITDANGCTVQETVEVELAPEPSLIDINPNPTAGNVIITHLDAFGLDEPILIEVMQIQGKIEQSFEVQGLANFEFQIDNNLFNGFYLVRVSNSRGSETRKLILIR